jgi:hypothetical protein
MAINLRCGLPARLFPDPLQIAPSHRRLVTRDVNDTIETSHEMSLSLRDKPLRKSNEYMPCMM